MEQQVPIFVPLCSCGVRLADIQRSIEEPVNPQMNRTQAMDQLGARMCCRAAIQNPPHYFLTDFSAQRLRDETGMTQGHNLASVANPILAGPAPIIPTIEIPSLPPLPV